MDNVAASLADIEARINGGIDWEGTDLDYAFAVSNFNVAILQHHMVDASTKFRACRFSVQGRVRSPPSS